jgi:hypothetical protein
MNSSRHSQKTTARLKLLSLDGQPISLASPTLKRALAKMALFLAEAWKFEHPKANPESEKDFNACVLQVTVEMAKAAKAVGGAASVAVLSGGGSESARFACRQILLSLEDSNLTLEDSSEDFL